MIEECANSWTPRQAKWLDSVLSSADGRRLIAHLRYVTRAVPLNLKLEPGVDFMQVNALVNRDREAKSQLIDDLVRMSQVKEPKQPFKDGIRTLLREEEKEPPAIQSKKNKQSEP